MFIAWLMTNSMTNVHGMTKVHGMNNVHSITKDHGMTNIEWLMAWLMAID